MRASVIISPYVAILVGFAGTIAIVLAAAQALNASALQSTSWVAALCLSVAISTLYLSIRHRMPIITAWSTPAAALMAATQGVTMEMAVAAFIASAVLLLITAIWRPVAKLVELIPTHIASAMLAGVLFNFVLAIFVELPQAPMLIAPLLFIFFILRVFSPMYAILVVLVVGVLISYLMGQITQLPDLEFSQFVLVKPEFNISTMIGLGIPMYLVTMASQNLPGFAVLKASDYKPPVSSILGITGLTSLVSAFWGAHTTNLAALTASICTSEDSHPDKDKRWYCGPFYAFGYLLLGLFTTTIVVLFSSFPQALIVTLAGVALMAPFINALQLSLGESSDRFSAIISFLITASGMSVFGIGSAFWGLAIGLFVYIVNKDLVKIKKWFIK